MGGKSVCSCAWLNAHAQADFPPKFTVLNRKLCNWADHAQMPRTGCNPPMRFRVLYFVDLNFKHDYKTALNIFVKHPPGLVVTRASCYSCVFSKTRRQHEMSNQLCMRNLEIIYGNKKSYGQKTDFYLSE